MNAQKLRWILSGTLVLLLGVIVASLWLMQRVLSTQVHATDHVQIDADVSEQEVAKLKKLQVELTAKKDLIDRTKQIAATAAQYQFQDQVIGDLTVYAKRQGFSVVSFNFAPATGSKQGAQPTGKTAFAVGLSSPIPYEKFLQFVSDIEKNLTKIQITSITLAPNPKNTKEILNPTVNLEVFLKK